MQRLLGVILGGFLFFPGAHLLRWLVVDELGLYQDMTLTDALLAIIIILACVIIFGQPRRPLSADELEEQAREMELASRRLAKAQEQYEEAQRAYRKARRSASRRSSTSRRGSGADSSSSRARPRSPRRRR